MESVGTIAVLGFALALMLAVALAVNYKRMLRVKLAFDEAKNRLSKGEKGYDELSKQYAESLHRNEERSTACMNLEQALEANQHKLATYEMQLNKAREETKESVRKLANEKDHWQQQAEALTEQLKEAIEEKRAKARELQKMAGRELEEGRHKLKIEEERLQSEAKNLKKELAEKDKEARQLAVRVKKLEDILNKINPEEIRKTKVKAHRMEQLYNSMKGLREMADERNQNWELALRELAAFIIKKPEDNLLAFCLNFFNT